MRALCRTHIALFCGYAELPTHSLGQDSDIPSGQMGVSSDLTGGWKDRGPGVNQSHEQHHYQFVNLTVAGSSGQPMMSKELAAGTLATWRTGISGISTRSVAATAIGDGPHILPRAPSPNSEVGAFGAHPQLPKAKEGKIISLLSFQTT
jgi:hypothetical protein